MIITGDTCLTIKDWAIFVSMLEGLRLLISGKLKPVYEYLKKNF